VERFFENLLPENRTIRARLAQRFRTNSTGAFDLLQSVGRDCAGALQVLPAHAVPGNVATVDAEPLTEAQVARLLRQFERGPPGTAGAGDDEVFRLSLAGAQEKTALLWHEDQWCRPLGATPTTHILKMPLGFFADGIDMSTSVDNELVCMRLLEALGVPAARVAALRFEDIRVLAVERFDRRRSQGGWLRLPQEDFAQVFGVDPISKYEDQGGPGIAAIAEQLRGSSQAEHDRLDFLRSQVVYWMLAAVDGHAKNFGVFIQARGAFRLVPRYDVLSAYPVMGTARGKLSPFKVRMAMAVWGKNRHYRWREIRRSHFLQTARSLGVPGLDAEIERLVSAVPAAIEAVSKQLASDVDESLSQSIFEGLRTAAASLRAR
jgi:serine/threonine-protein kinase HipA